MTSVSIIGAGIMGLTAAWRLTQAGYHVTVYEAAHAIGAAGSTAASLGGLVPFGFSRTNELAVQQRQSLHLWPQIAKALQEQTGQSIGYTQGGRYQLLQTQGQYDQAVRDATASNGLQTLIKPQDLPQGVTQAPFGALHCNLTGWLKVPDVLHVLATAITAQGGQIHLSSPITNVDSLKTDYKIITAGAGTQQIAQNFPILPIKGQAIRLKMPKPCLKSMLKQGQIYLIPHGREFLVGSTTETVNDTIPTEEAKNQLFQSACQMFPALKDAQIIAHWAGQRPKSETNTKLYTQVNDTTFIAAGHYKIGLCLAPIVSLEILNHLNHLKSQ